MTAPNLTADINTVWTLSMAALVFFMHAGFGFYEAGMCREKNTVDTLAHNLTILAITLGFYWLIGFGLMYGKGNGFSGAVGFAPTLVPSEAPQFPTLATKPVPLIAAFAFALSFADTPATLIAGSGAERIRFSAVVLLAMLISTVIFPLVGHWNAGGGWFTSLTPPVYDTGSGMIQLCGGGCALAVALILGPRRGVKRHIWGEPDYEISSMPMVFLGTFVLWLGFLGFNAGYALRISGATGLVIINTLIASGFGALSALTGAWVLTGKARLRTALVGVLTASVAITSPSAIVAPWAAAVIGALSGAMTVGSIRFWSRAGIDDPTEYLTMNVFGGILGLLAVGLFASPAILQAYPPDTPLGPGLFYGGGWGQTASEAIAAGTIVAFAFALCAIACIGLRALNLLRVTPEEECEGSDVATHGEHAEQR